MDSIEEVEDITNFDDEFDDFMSLSNETESGGGTFKASFREFSKFEGEFHSAARSIAGTTVESGEMIIAAVPEGVFDDAIDAFNLWAGNDLWDGELTKTTEKFLLEQEQLRMANLAVGNYDNQFYEDLENGLGLGQRYLDATAAQTRIVIVALTAGFAVAVAAGGAAIAGMGAASTTGAATAVGSMGIRSVASAAIRTGGMSIARSRAAIMASMGESAVARRLSSGAIGSMVKTGAYSVPGALFVDATGFGIGKSSNSVVQDAATTVLGHDSEAEYYLLRQLEEEAEENCTLVGFEGSHDIQISGRVEDVAFNDGAATLIERRFYNENGQQIGLKGYSLSDYARLNPSVDLDQIQSYSQKELIELSTAGGLMVNSGSKMLPAKVDKVYINHRAGNEEEEAGSYLTYKFMGNHVEDKLKITAETYGNKESYEFAHYKTNSGTLVYSEMKEYNPAGQMSMSPAGMMIGGFHYSIDDDMMDYSKAVRGAALGTDYGIRVLNRVDAMKRVNHIHMTLNSLHTVSRINAGLVSALQAFTFTEGGTGSIFDILGGVIDAPLAGMQLKIYNSQLKVADRMAILNTALMIFQSAAIGQGIGSKAYGKGVGLKSSASNFTRSLSEWMTEEEIENLGEGIRAVVSELEEMISESARSLNFGVDNANMFYDKRAFNLNETISKSTIYSPMSLGETLLSESKKGLKRIGSIQVMSVGINLGTGNYQVQAMNTFTRELDILKGFMFDSVYESALKQAEHALFNTPVVSGLFSGKTLAIAVTSFSFGNISRAIRNNELQSLREVQKDVKYTFESDGFGAAAEDLKLRMEREGISVDLRDLVNTGEIHLRTVDIANGHSIGSQTLVTSSISELENLTAHAKENIIKSQMKSMFDSLKGKYEASRYFFAEPDEIKNVLVNNVELANQLGMQVVEEEIYRDNLLLEEEELYRSLVEGLSTGNYKSWYKTVGMDGRAVDDLFSSDKAFLQKLSANQYVSNRLGVVFDEAGAKAYYKRDIIDEFYEGDFEKYREDPNLWKEKEHVAAIPVSNHDLRSKTMNFIKNDHAGLSNQMSEEKGKEILDYYESTLSKSADIDDWTGSTFSKVKSEQIHMVNVNSTKNFWVSFATFSVFGNRDPITMDGRYTFQAMRLRGNIHNSDVFSNIMSSVNTGAPMSLLGFPVGLTRQDYSDDWRGSMISSDFEDIADNMDFDNRFFDPFDEEDDNFINNENMDLIGKDTLSVGKGKKSVAGSGLKRGVEDDID